MNQPKFRPVLKGKSSKKVFSKGRSPRPISILRQFFEALLLLSLGSGAFALLSWIPRKIDAMVLVSEAVADLIRGVTQLVEACLGFAAVLLIALLVLLALVAFIAGTLRLIRGCMRLKHVSASKSVRPLQQRSKRKR